MSAALARFAQDAGRDATHRAALVLDRAGWPTAASMVIPAGIALGPLPPAAPARQPAERGWPHLKEAVANRAFAARAAWETMRGARCRPRLARSPHVGWWPTDRQPVQRPTG